LVLVPAELEGAFEHAPVGDPGEWVGQRLPLSDVEANNDRDPVAVPMAQEHADLEDRPVADGGQERAPGPTQLPTGVIDIVEQVVVAVPPDHLGRAVTGKSFRGRVPVGDPTFGVDGVDRLAHGLQESLGRRPCRLHDQFRHIVVAPAPGAASSGSHVPWIAFGPGGQGI
jgi:hypothetical protein